MQRTNHPSQHVRGWSRTSRNAPARCCTLNSSCPSGPLITVYSATVILLWSRCLSPSYSKWVALHPDGSTSMPPPYSLLQIYCQPDSACSGKPEREEALPLKSRLAGRVLPSILAVLGHRRCALPALFSHPSSGDSLESTGPDGETITVPPIPGSHRLPHSLPFKS